jgi:hypothetical protein
MQYVTDENILSAERIEVRTFRRPRRFVGSVPRAEFMDQVNTFTVYDLGQVLARVKSLGADDRQAEWRSVLNDAYPCLREWLGFNEQLLGISPSPRINIEHSKRSCEDLLSVIIRSLNRLVELGEARPLKLGERFYDPELAQLVSELEVPVRAFEANLESELAEAPTFYISQVGIFSTKDLLSQADKKLSETSHKLCSQFAVEDIKRSASCLAMHQFTACGFHALRAIEDVARKYSKAIVKNPKHTGDVLTLGLVINNLRGQLEEKGEPKEGHLGLIVAYMARIKDIFRNRIMHPDMVLDQDEAVEVFDLAFLTINAITRDLSERGIKSLEPVTL